MESGGASWGAQKVSREAQGARGTSGGHQGDHGWCSGSPLASPLCDPISIPVLIVSCGLGLLMVLALRGGVFYNLSGFPPSTKTIISKLQLILIWTRGADLSVLTMLRLYHK